MFDENNSLGTEKEIDNIHKNIPSLENNGVTKETTITYEEAEDRIIEKKVNKPREEVTVIPKTIKYIKDGNREVGTPDEITEGKDGSKTTTTTYEVNENTGEVIEHKGEPVIVAPVPTVVSVGAKDKVIVKDRTDGAKTEGEGELSSAISRLLVVQENYPELKADKQASELTAELAGTENRLFVVRKDYNEIATKYNKAIRTFPNNMLAGMFGFERADLVEAPKEAQTAPKVDLN